MTKRFTFPSNLMVFSALLLLLPSVALAQITGVGDDQSTPTPGTGHNYLKMVNETVNPANGSVSVRIGMPVPKGRGLTLPFDFAYDSNGANHVIPSFQSNAGWTFNNGFGFGGWSDSLPKLTWSYPTATANISGVIYYCVYVTSFVFQDPTGGRHSLGLTYYVDTYGQCMYFSNQIPYPQFMGGDQFYNAVTTPPTGGLVMVSNNVDGTAYSFDVTPSGVSSLASWVEDRNGNRVTLSGCPTCSPITVTDTLGRTSVSVSGSGGNNSTQSVSVSGLASPYVATWETQYYSRPQPTQQLVSSSGYCNSSPIPSIPNGAEYVITSLELPNSQSYQFTYDSTYGLLTQVTYPTGGWVRYTWGVNSLADQIALPDNLNDAASCVWNYDFPAVTERQVSFDGVNVALQQTFSYTTNSGSWYKTTTVTTTDNISGNTTVTNYDYNAVTVPGGLYPSIVPVEGAIAYKDGSGNTYRAVNKTWSDPNLMTCESTTQGGITSRTDYYPGAGVPLTDKKEWDWGQAPACGSAASGTPRRETQTTYQYFNVQAYPSGYWQYGDPVFAQPTSVTTYYNGAQAAQTTYTYDGAGIQSSGVSATGHDNTHYGTSFTARANATTKSAWLNTGGALNWNYTYDDAGQPWSVQDPNSNSTSYSYANDDAYLSQITYPTTNGHAHTLSFTYNSADGQLASSTDENGQTTSYFYGQNGDELDRLTGVNNPDCNVCSSTVHSVSTTYNDSAPSPSVTTSTLLQSSRYSTSQAIMDGVGHTVQTQLQTDPAGTDYTATTYDGFGRVWKVSNPHRSTSDPTYGLTTTTYDPLGRTISVAHPDGSITSTTYSASGSTYCSTVTDPAGKQRVLCSDALGQLVQVTEGGLNYSTGYTYDAFHFWVSQGAQTRTFTYDSLRRKLSAATPETTDTYTYPTPSALCAGDPSAVCTRTDGSGATYTYSYDALNRVTSETYTDGSPTLNFSYDEATVALGSWTSPTLGYPVGRLTHTTTTSGGATLTATVQDYDPMGRTKDYWQCTPLNCGSSSIWAVLYNYDLAGDVVSWNHPAGFTITQTINGAQQVSQVTSSLNDQTHPGTLANVTYTPFGAVSTLQNGCVGSGCTSVQESYFYNKLLEMVVEELGTASNHSADSCRVYNYYVGAQNAGSCSESPSAWPAGSNNNANVAGYNYFDNANSGLSHGATYSYDAVNRLVSAVATGNVTYNQTYTFTGDGSNGQYGNMSCAPSGPGCQGHSYSATTNQITDPGYLYGGRGNNYNDGTNSYAWSDEGRLLSVTKIATGATLSTNTYNALLQRVRDVSQSETTDEVYGAGSSLLWRYTGNSSDPNQRAYVPFNGGILAEYWSGGTLFDHPDELGSISASTDQTGNNLAERLFYPFGEAWTGIDLNGFNPHQTFAKQADYDPEIDMYNDPHRHYSPTDRWPTPDPGGMDVIHPDAPQTWNRYAYVANNPTTLADPSGLDPVAAPGKVEEGSCDPAGSDCDHEDQDQANNNANGTANGSQSCWGCRNPNVVFAHGDYLAFNPVQDLKDVAKDVVDDVVKPLVESAEGALDVAGGGIVNVLGQVIAVPLAIILNAQDLNRSEDKHLEELNASKEHTKGASKSKWQKHTKPRPGRSTTKDRQKPGWKPRTPPRPQAYDPDNN